MTKNTFITFLSWQIHKKVCIFYMYMTFEWDEKKNSENIKKHMISFEKAQDAFFDENRIVWFLEDVKHSVSEKRYFCIGKTDEGILIVRFTMRGQNIRIFVAGYWRQGKKRYEEHLWKSRTVRNVSLGFGCNRWRFSSISGRTRQKKQQRKNNNFNWLRLH